MLLLGRAWASPTLASTTVEMVSVIVQPVIRSHTVCSNLVLAYSILLSKIVTTIGTVHTARVHDDRSYLSGRLYSTTATCIPQLPQVGHTVCSNLVLAYSILLSKTVTTIGTVPTACAHTDHSYLSGHLYSTTAACIPQLPQVGPVSDKALSVRSCTIL